MVVRGLRRVAGLCAAIAVMAVWGAARADVDDRGFYLGFRALPAIAAGEDEAIAGGPICPTGGRALFVAGGVARRLKWPVT